MAEPHLILFDCDGTIVDSEGLIIEAMKRAFNDEGLEAPEPAAIRRIIGLSLPLAVAHLGAPSDEDIIMNVSEAYRQRYSYLRDKEGMEEPLFEGMHQLITELGSRDEYILGIATGKTMKGVDNLLNANQLTHLFHTIQTSDKAPSKPNPAMIFQALSETGITPERTVMIGDTTFDLEMANNARVGAIGVTWGHHEAKDLAAHSPRFLIDKIADLKSTIEASFSAAHLN